jgi:hypothetical protein
MGEAGGMASVPAQTTRKKKQFRIQSEAVMLTYQGLSDTSSWAPFLQFVAEQARWKVKNWTATMEANAEGGVHTHLMLQFMSTQDRKPTSLQTF